jgi:hypothetical protein
LTAIFSKANNWKKAIENPAKEVKMLKVNNVHVRFLDEEEEYRILGEYKGHIHLLVISTLYISFIVMNFLSLRTEDIDFA